jgi:hypothetical protein
MKLETSCVPIVFPVRNFPRGKPRAFVRGIRILWSPLDRYHVCIRCKSTSIEEPGRKDESLLDNIEITREEREAIAARLRARRLRKRREINMNINRKDRAGGRLFEDIGGSKRLRSKTETFEDESSGAGASGRFIRSQSSAEQESYLGWGEGSSNDSSWESDTENFERKTKNGKETNETAPVSDEYQDTTKVLNPPDILILSPNELDRVLPILPFAAQAGFFTGGAAQSVQRWAASLALTLLFSKAALLAATSLTWPLWWPWARAVNKNYGIRSKIEYGGIWRTTVINIEKGNRPRPQYNGTEERDEQMSRFSAMRSCHILIGEENGAQIEMTLPYDARFDLLQPGQPAEVVVLSNTTSFDDIKAVRDVYLPENGLWLSEYPYIDRSEFLDISLDIEREFPAVS